MRLSTRHRKQSKRKVPQLNTTATADISFMLLIFFLITTSMDADKGMPRQLPPRNDQTEVSAVNVDKDKVLTIAIKENHDITINDSVVSDQQLCTQMADFVKRVGDEHIIEIQADRNADYNTYFHLQNLIVHTYRSKLKGKYKQRISEQFI